VCLMFDLEACQCQASTSDDFSDRQLCQLCCMRPDHLHTCRSAARRRHTHAAILDYFVAHLFRSSYSSPMGWLGSRVVSVLDSGAEGPGFKSQPRRCRVTVFGKLFTPIMPLFTKQQNW